MFNVFARREMCCGSDDAFDRGRTGGGNVIEAKRLVLRRDGRLARGRVLDCALLLNETEVVRESLLFPAAGCEGAPTRASCIMGCCSCAVGLGPDGRTRRCGSQ